MKGFKDKGGKFRPTGKSSKLDSEQISVKELAKWHPHHKTEKEFRKMWRGMTPKERKLSRRVTKLGY